MNLQYIKSTYVDNITASNVAYDYHPTLFLFDWQPYSITYWKSTQTTDNLHISLTSSMQIQDKYLIIENDNWASFDLWDSASTPNVISYTQTIQGNFRILKITSSMTISDIYIYNITATSGDVLAGQVLFCDIAELNENPVVPFKQTTSLISSSSFRGVKGNLINYTIGQYINYVFDFNFINTTTITEITSIYSAMIEHPILLTLGEVDTSWRWVGIKGGTSLEKTKLVSSYYSTSLAVENIESEA